MYTHAPWMCTQQWTVTHRLCHRSLSSLWRSNFLTEKDDIWRTKLSEYAFIREVSLIYTLQSIDKRIRAYNCFKGWNKNYAGVTVFHVCSVLCDCHRVALAVADRPGLQKICVERLILGSNLFKKKKKAWGKVSAMKRRKSRMKVLVHRSCASSVCIHLPLPTGYPASLAVHYIRERVDGLLHIASYFSNWGGSL